MGHPAGISCLRRRWENRLWATSQEVALSIGDDRTSRPEGAACRLDDLAPGSLRLSKNRIDLFVGARIVSEIDARNAETKLDTRILLRIGAGEEAENRAAH